MRWGIFILFLFVALVLDSSFSNVFQIGSYVPALIPCLAVFVALGAPRYTALWACLIIGLVVDLSARISLGTVPTRGLYLIGPWTLGYFVGSHLILPLRTMVFRRNPLTMGAMTLLFLLIASLVAVSVMLVRSWYPGTSLVWPNGSAFQELVWQGVRALYCAAIAVPAGWLLTRTTPLWGFHPSVQRSARW